MTNEELSRRVALIEEFHSDLQGLLRKYLARSAQPELVTAEVQDDRAQYAQWMKEKLVSTFMEVTKKSYVFEGAKDFAAVKRLVVMNISREDVVERWREALKRQVRPTQSIALFAMRINEFGNSISPMARPVSGDPYAR